MRLSETSVTIKVRHLDAEIGLTHEMSVHMEAIPVLSLTFTLPHAFLNSLTTMTTANLYFLGDESFHEFSMLNGSSCLD